MYIANGGNVNEKRAEGVLRNVGTNKLSLIELLRKEIRPRNTRRKKGSNTKKKKRGRGRKTRSKRTT